MGDIDSKVREFMSRVEALPEPQRDALIAEIEKRNDAALEGMMCDLSRKVAAAGVTPSSLPIGQSFAMDGRWRVYFNRHGAEPLMWCVAPDAGGWEVAVRSVGISTFAETVYAPKATTDDEDGKPSAWIVVDGYLTVHQIGHATIGSL